MTPRDLVVTPRGLRFRGQLLPCVIGRAGIVRNKREGDGATPAGVLHIVDILYRADRLARPAEWARPIGPRDLWSDDPADCHYNQRVLAPHDHSHERLRRGDRLYDLILVTDWNADGDRGQGSAIFLHRWRRRAVPTEGCIALPPQHLLWLARRIDRGTRVVV